MEANCGSTTPGLLTIGEKGFGFDPFQSTTVLYGSVSADGRLKGALTRPGGDRQNLTISFEGIASGEDAIGGTLQSGRCRWTVNLHRG